MPRVMRVRDLDQSLTAALTARLQARGNAIAAVLVTQARRRVANKGDSTHRYPDLWATRTGLGFRAHGEPLRDRGQLLAALSAQAAPINDGVSLRLLDGTPDHYGVYHQHGFETKGPNFIPLTLKARRIHRKGNDPKAEGLVRGKDYIMAWHGVTVPQRKLFNMPPEDLREIRWAIAAALKG